MGKTFVAAYVTREGLRDGGTVLYIDQENGLRIMAEQATALGIAPELAQRLQCFWRRRDVGRGVLATGLP